MSHHDDAARWRTNWQNEVDAVETYRLLADLEKQPQLAELYRRMAAVEQDHVRHWEERMKAAGMAVGPQRASLQARITGWLARRFGPQAILPMLSAREQTHSRVYDHQPDAKSAGLPGDEHSHARLLQMIAHSPGGGMEGGALARLEGRHRGVGGNALRAAVLGSNDGLVSNLSLVMGVAGADLASHTILITGLAGLLAGACSMAMGEWLSVQSSRELYERQIEVEADEIAEAPEEEQEELALIYQAKGLPADEARALAAKMMADRENVLDTLTREELGINPEELGGSAWEAAISSFVLFVAGAIVPVIPFVFLAGRSAVATSLGLSAVALFLIGSAITLLTGRGAVRAGIRQLLIGMCAAGVTFCVGKLIGAAVSG